MSSRDGKGWELRGDWLELDMLVGGSRRIEEVLDSRC